MESGRERESEMRVCITVFIMSITKCIQRGLQSWSAEL